MAYTLYELVNGTANQAEMNFYCDAAKTTPCPIYSTPDFGVTVGAQISMPITLAPLGQSGYHLLFLAADNQQGYICYDFGTADVFFMEPAIGGGGGSSFVPPTGTGYVHITGGVMDAAADPDLLHVDGTTVPSTATLRKGGTAAQLAASAVGDYIDSTGS